MTGTPTPNFGLPQYDASDTAALDVLLNGITTVLDTNLAATLNSQIGFFGLRRGTTTQRNAATAVEGDYWSDTTTDLLYRHSGSKWLIAPGQTLARAETTANPSVPGIIGGVISTPVLEVGQKVRISCRPVGLANTLAGGVSFFLAARNNAADVTSATYDKTATSRIYQGGGGNVVSSPGLSFEMTTTAAAKVSAAMYLTTGFVYNADGQEIWIESV